MKVSRVKQTVTLGAENVVRIEHDRPVYRWQTALDREPSADWIRVFRASTLTHPRLPKFRDRLDFHGENLFFDAAEDSVEEAVKAIDALIDDANTRYDPSVLDDHRATTEHADKIRQLKDQFKHL
jgi:hypothetical protein